MDFDFFRRILFEMRKEGVEEIGLFYLGESFLYPRLEEAVRFAKHNAGFPYVFLTTNGSISTPKKVAQLIEAGLDSLKFSVNYADKEQFEQVARVKGKMFDAMLTNIKGCREARDEIYHRTGKWCGLYASYIKFNDEQDVAMRDLIDNHVSHWVDEVYALPLYNQAAFIEEGEGDWQFSAGNRGRIGALRDPLPCWALFTEGHITYDGKLSACCFDHDGRFHMGDLNREGFMQSWNSERFQWLRQANLAKDVRGTPCENCVAYF
jgi:radical SAM protein with 4Fe4S-binding SPASM domain